MDIPGMAAPRTFDFRVGDTVRVGHRVVEGDRERLQTFEGVVLGMRGGGSSATFTLRRLARGIGVERTFLIQSPRLEKVDVLRRGKVRRARLYYLRGLKGRKARIKEATQRP